MFLDAATSRCAQYAQARSQPALYAGVRRDDHVHSTADTPVVYQRWCERRFQVHVREQSEEERQMRLRLYEAWQGLYGPQGTRRVISEIRGPGGVMANAVDVCSMMVYHGVPSLAVAMRIAQHGMMNLSTTDAGYYGRGFYFTTDLNYALRYARPDASSEDFSTWWCVRCCAATRTLWWRTRSQPDSQA